MNRCNKWYSDVGVLAVVQVFITEKLNKHKLLVRNPSKHAHNQISAQQHRKINTIQDAQMHTWT
jgi:hypothetical protein